MAQDITLLGASYSAVPAVTLPKTGGGTASFTDITDSTITAATVKSGEIGYQADGTRIVGTYAGGSGFSPKKDGKTHLYITIPESDSPTADQMTMYVYMNCTKANGVSINWGDGSTGTLTTGDSYASHQYASPGDYEITLTVNSGTMRLGMDSSTAIYGSTADSGAFRRHMLRNIEIGNGVNAVHPSVFTHAEALENVYLYGADLATTYANMFRYCYALRNIDLSKGTFTSTGNYFAQYCYSLRKVVLPSTITTISAASFSPSYCLQEFEMPSSVTSIANSGFANCQGLLSVTIPSGVTSIGTTGFSNAYSLREIHVKPTSPPTIQSDTFSGLNSSCVIYVPSAKLTTYKNASNWTSYKNQMVGE